MKRVVRQAAIFVGLFLLVGLLRLPFGNYEDSIVSSIKEYGKASGVFIDVGSAELGFPVKLDLSQVSFIVPTEALPIPFYLDTLQLRPKLLSLLLLRSGLRAAGTMYSGDINSELAYRFWGKQGALTLDAKKMAIGQHPLLGGFGVTGTANVQAQASFAPPDDGMQPFIMQKATVSVEVSDGSYVGGHKLKGLLELPAAKDVRITAVAKVDEQTLTIGSTEVLSSLGSLRGSGTVVLSQGLHPREIDLGVTIKLTSSGADAFAAYLALAAGLPIDSPPRDWQVTIKKSANQRMPNTKVQPL